MTAQPSLSISVGEDERYRLLIDAITDYAIYMLDVDGFVSSWNPGARRFKGYEAGEIVGQHFSKFYTDEDKTAGLPQRSLRIAASEGRFETEGWRLRKDGSRFWAHVVVDPIRDPNGHVVGFAKITRDLSERRRSQDSLERAQQALAQTQKLEALGKLTGGIAHDFNNLLTAISGCLELLEKRLAPDDSRSLSLLRNAMHGAARGSNLTQRMLAFARRQDLKLEAVSIRELVDGMIDLLDRSIGPTFTLNVNIKPGLRRVRSDSNQLETALLNLAINARDAMPNGGTIRIDAQEIDVVESDELPLKPGAYLSLSVSDDGQGMDAETLARAAEPFFTTKGIGKGTGLGLSMVHGLVEQSGGTLRISSESGVGTIVELILPAADADEKPAIADTLTTPVDDRALLQQPKTVLVVDDDELVLVSIVALLEDIGYRVLKAGGGAAALELLASDPAIDIIVTDQAMPGMTGLQFAKVAALLRPHVPIVLASGYAELTVPTDNLIRLAKPFRRAEIARVLASALHPAAQ